MKIKILLFNALLCTSLLCFSQADLPNNGISGPIHQKYLGKIVFALSGDAVAKGNEKESEFVTRATFGGEIYYRAYLDNSLLNYLKNTLHPDVNGRWKIKFYIDGNEAGVELMQRDFFSKEQKQGYTTFKGALKSMPDGDATGEIEFKRFMRKNEDKFTMGDHVLKIEYIPYSEEPKEFDGPVVASGEITLSIKKALADPNDVKTCLPKALMSDKVLEASILKAFNAKGWTEKAVKVRIISSQWNIEKNKRTGAIISRYVDAVIGSTEDSKCAYQNFSFYQDYDGKAYQKEVYLSGTGDKVDISCGCLK
jgi:hypothetical protein